jgi:2'-5' RNA ligase
MTQTPNGSAAGRTPDRSARLFAALWLPPEIRDQLSAHLEATLTGWHTDPPNGAGPGPTQLRRTRADTWHVTLAFLAEAPLDRTVRRFLGSPHGRPPGVALPPAKQLQLTGGGHFGPVVWVAVAHDGWLSTLAAAMQHRLAVTDRRFQAHVTVGRGRGPGAGPVNVARQAAQQLGNWDGPVWTPAEVLLVESILGAHPQYPIRARLRLD